MIGIGHLDVCVRVQKLRKEEKRVVPSEEEDPPGRLLPDSLEPSTLHAYGRSPTPTRLGHRGNTTGTGTSNQLRYLRTLLGRAGFSGHLPVSFAFLHSPAHPLDPSLFDSLEQDHDGSFCDLHTRPNRRLLFCLTNEILGRVLRPHLHSRLWLPSSRGPLALSLPVPTGVELLERTWTRILAFPGAHCQTLQDIDELVGSDIPEVGLDGDGVEEEWEEIAVDIGRRILDFLVDETASGLLMPDRGCEISPGGCLTRSRGISGDWLLLARSYKPINPMACDPWSRHERAN